MAPVVGRRRRRRQGSGRGHGRLLVATTQMRLHPRVAPPIRGGGRGRGVLLPDAQRGPEMGAGPETITAAGQRGRRLRLWIITTPIKATGISTTRGLGIRRTIDLDIDGPGPGRERSARGRGRGRARAVLLRLIHILAPVTITTTTTTTTTAAAGGNRRGGARDVTGTEPPPPPPRLLSCPSRRGS